MTDRRARVDEGSLIGRQFGAYRIDERIGAGGMGEVYRAHDTKLGRDVAIKILPHGASWDADRLARLTREARTLAALNHPHIGAIYGLEESDGVRGLVLELVDGVTLADRLARGPLPIAEAVRFAGQIASALEGAHAKGIVHRDLKPANIKINSAGAVKVLDFGLAKAETSEAEETTLATREGVVMGTPSYMSPEQARGEAVDSQTDLWAFGCVLYEMLTGRIAFGGPTASDSIAAVLQREPDWAALPVATPASVRKTLARCLEKPKARRLHSAADVRVDLEDVRDFDNLQPKQQEDHERAHRRGSSDRLVAWCLGLGWVATLAAGLYFYTRPHGATPQPAATYAYDIPLPPETTHGTGLALSPDGKRVAAVTIRERDARLWVRDLDSTGDWQFVSGAGSETPSYPIWSPDSRSLAFFTGGKLVRVDLPGLVAIPLCEADGRGGVWLDDGTIVFASGTETGLQRIDAKGGTPSSFLDLQQGELSLRYPSRAGRDHLLYFVAFADGRPSEIRLVSLEDRTRSRTVVASVQAGVFDNGTLFYSREGVWVGQGFDPVRNSFIGDARPLRLDAAVPQNISGPALSAQAGHVASANLRRQQFQATWFDRSGQALTTLGEPADQTFVEISPDGRRVAVSKAEPGAFDYRLWIHDFTTGGEKPTARSVTTSAVWHHDSSRIAFSARSPFGGIPIVYEVSGGFATPRPIYEAAAPMQPAGWVRGSDRFVFTVSGQPGSSAALAYGIYYLDPGGKPELVRQGSGSGRLSADGERIAYTSSDTGKGALYVDSFPAPGAKPMIVAAGAVSNPRWSPDGRGELYFSQAGYLMVATISPGAPLTVGPPSRLFKLASNFFAVDHDAKRFLVMVPTSPRVSTVRMTMNWKQ